MIKSAEKYENHVQNALKDKICNKLEKYLKKINNIV